MKRRILGNPVWSALALTALTVGVQLWAATAIDQTANRQLAIYATIAVVALCAVVLWVMSLCGPRGGLLFWGEGSGLLGAGAVAAGAGLLVTNGGYLYAWMQNGATPPPYPYVYNTMDDWLVRAVLLFGVLGGLALFLCGVRWLWKKRVDTVLLQWMSMMPVVWALARLARYVQSYPSTIRNAYTFADTAMLMLSLVFLFLFGQHLTARSKITGAALPAMALATGVSCVSNVAARFLLQTLWPDTLSGAILMTDAGDLCIGVFALCVGAVACSRAAAEKTQTYLAACEAEKQAQLNAEAAQTATQDGTDAPSREQSIEALFGAAPAEEATASVSADVENLPAEEGE